MLVSVIIPVYNSEKTISRSIESVVVSLTSCTDDYEIICVDDGSSDNSLELLKKIALENSKIIVIHQDNAGAASARNRGLETAKGDFIAFNDSDDEWTEDHAEVLLSLFDEFSDISCISGMHEDEKWRLAALKKEKNNFYRVVLKNQLYKNYFSPPSTMLRRIIVDCGIRFVDGARYAEEGCFFNHISAQFGCGFIDKKLSASILHKGRFGDCGLSGNLLGMERGEISNLIDARRNLGVGFFTFAGALVYSILKYFRRIVIAKLRRAK